MNDVIRITKAVQDVDWSSYPKAQCIVTSPPYWDKRVYEVPDTLIGGDWVGQLGQEATPQLFIQHLADIMNDLPLAAGGVMWINIGDTYVKHATHEGGLKPGDLAMIPERLAMAMQERGWWLRSMVVWSKKNGMPESVKNRPVGKYEKILMLTRSRDYFYASEAVREPVSDVSITRYKYGVHAQKYDNHHLKKFIDKSSAKRDEERPTRPVRNVWEFPTANSRSEHIAPMPTGLAERCILLTSRAGDVVLDPFAGSGTTMRAAHGLGRVAMGVDLDGRFSDWTSDVGQQAALV